MELNLKRLRMIFQNEILFHKSNGEIIRGKIYSYSSEKDNEKSIISVGIYDLDKKDYLSIHLNEVNELTILEDNDKIN